LTKPRAIKPELVTAALLALVVLGAPRRSGAQPEGGAPATPTPASAPATPSAAPATPSPAPATPSAAPATPSAASATPSPAPGPTVAAATEGTAELSGLQVRIKAAQDKAGEIKDTVGSLRDKHTITDSQAAAYERQIASWSSTLSALDEQATHGGAQQPLSKQTALAEAGLSAIKAQLTDVSNATGWNLVGTLLRARCATAICFDNGEKKDWLGIEPLVELPVGKSLALSKSSLSNYVDNHELRIDLAAGARVWLFRDIVSVSVYISKPLTDGRIRLEGSPFVYPAASIRRPYPGIALGLLFDSLWLGFDRDELRNGDGQDVMAVNPDFPPNTVVSSTWTLTVALQPVTAFRTAIGTAVQATGRNGR